MLKLFIFLVALALSYCVEQKSPEEGDAFEGDMMLNPDQISAITEQLSGRNKFALVRSNHWITNGVTDTIKYYIDPQINGARQVIKDAINDYQTKTCLRFQEYTGRPNEPHFFFTTGSGCFSPVGKSRRGNKIQLAQGCWVKGIVIHEMGHSLGFYHEQSRPDRDYHVTIQLQNIQSKWAYAFNKYGTDRIDSLGSPYDVDSIMHYGSRYFSKNGQITIKTRNPQDQNKIGQRRGFSTQDLIQINKLYCGGTGGSSCVDKNASCPSWRNYCTTNSHVIANCKKTCNLC